MNTDDIKQDDAQVLDDTAQVVEETPVEETQTEAIEEQNKTVSENPVESSDAEAMEDKEVTEEAVEPEEEKISDNVIQSDSEESKLESDPSLITTLPFSEGQDDKVVTHNDKEDSQNNTEEVASEEAPQAEETASEEKSEETKEEAAESAEVADSADSADAAETQQVDVPGAHWYVVHTYSGHENRVAASLKQRIESEHLEHKILDVLVPTQEKIEIRSGKKENVKEKIFPGYILVRMVLDDLSWLAVRTTQGVTSFVGMSNKPTAIPDREVKSIVSYMTQGAQPTYKTTFSENDTVKIIDGPFAEFIGKVESVDKERGKIKVLVSIFGRETPVELDFLQVAKL